MEIQSLINKIITNGYVQIIVPLIIVSVQIIKSFFQGLDKRWYPLVSVIIGIFWAWLGLSMSLGETILVGALTGLAGSGLWKFGKSTVLGK